MSKVWAHPRWFAALLVGLALSGTSAVVQAQSAADKATARKLATEGIELYQAGKYPEALDKLQRAQALYDAPVHLLYIARSQAKENQWVEAAETYRKLVRVKLEPGAPEAFQQAIDDGRTELAELEPKIPSLKVEVTPAGVEGLSLSIDGDKVSAAAVGVERPLNPGEHTIVAEAPGYERSEQKVTVEPGAKQSLPIALVAGGAGATTAPKRADEPAAAEAKVETPKKFGFFVGVGLFGAIPAGNVGTFSLAGVSTDRSMSDVMQGGGGLELHGGVRFARYFAGALYVDLLNMSPVDELEGSQISGVEAGLVARAGTEAHRFGGYGELGFGFAHSFQVTDSLGAAVPDPPSGCQADITLKGGPSLRIGGGGIIPIGKYFHLTPFMVASFAQFNSAEATPKGCTAGEILAIESAELSEGGAHQLFLIGLGGDWLIGG